MHLEKRKSWPFPEDRGGPVRFTLTNRGEPYREGFDVSIGGSVAPFIEEQDVARLVKFLGNPPLSASPLQ